MLRHTIFLSALILWVASIFDDSLGDMIYLIWGVAFLFSIYGHSMFFALISFLMSVSYSFIDTSSQSSFFAMILPWIFGVLVAIFVLIIGVKYLSHRKMEYHHDYSDVHKNSPQMNFVWFDL